MFSQIKKSKNPLSTSERGERVFACLGANQTLCQFPNWSERVDFQPRISIGWSARNAIALDSFPVPDIAPADPRRVSSSVQEGLGQERTHKPCLGSLRVSRGSPGVHWREVCPSERCSDLSTLMVAAVKHCHKTDGNLPKSSIPLVPFVRSHFALVSQKTKARTLSLTGVSLVPP